MISDVFKTYYFVKCTFIMVKSARDLQYALNEISVYCIKWKWNVYFEKISFIKATLIKKKLPFPITSISLYVLLAITNYLFCLHVFWKILYSIFFLLFLGGIIYKNWKKWNTFKDEYCSTLVFNVFHMKGKGDVVYLCKTDKCVINQFDSIISGVWGCW